MSIISDLIDSLGIDYIDFMNNVISSVPNSEDRVWSMFVPWDYIIAATILMVFVICLFRIVRSVLWRM